MSTSRVLSPSSGLWAVALVMIASAGCASSKGSEQTSSRTSTAEQAQTSETSRNASSQSSGEPSEAAAGMSQSSSGSVSDDQLREFYRVSLEIKKIQKKTERQMKQATSRRAAKKLKTRAQTQVQSVFQNSSMDKRTYRGILKRLKTDKKLQKRMKRIQMKNAQPPSK